MGSCFMISLNNTSLLGHRGARGEQLENTLLGFEHAQRLHTRGLTGIEFDVQLSADGHLMVFHDDDLKRMCGQQARLSQLTGTEIERYIQSGHPIIRLASMAPLLSDFTTIELEIKTHNRTNYALLLSALVRDLIDTPLARLPIVLTSFDVELHGWLQRYQALRHIPRGLLIETPGTLATAIPTALRLGCIQLGVHYPLLNPTIIAQSHRYGLPVSAWTVNDRDSIQQLVQWQTDVIITDFPSLFLSS